MAKKVVCAQCGTVGFPKLYTPGSIIVEALAYLLLILPGLVYSNYRLRGRKRVCRSCGGTEIVPTDSPRGRELIERYQSG